MAKIIGASRVVGSYDILHENQKQAKWHIDLPEGSPQPFLTVCVEPDSEYDYKDNDNLCWFENDPWLVIDKLERHLKECVWISTSKEGKLGLIKWIRDNKATLRPDWLKRCIEYKQKRIKVIQNEIDDLDSELEELTNLAEEQTNAG